MTRRTGPASIPLAALLAVALLAAADPVRASAQSADERLAEAERLIAAGQADQAIVLLNEALALDPRHWRSLCRLGEAQMAAKRLPEAEKALREAVAIQPDAVPCLSRLAQILLMSERLSEAEPFLARAAALSPADASLIFNLARLYEQTERSEEAIESYRRFLAVSPPGPRAATARLKVARILASASRPLEAFEHYRAYLADQPDRHEVRAEYALHLMGASRYEESLAEYERVIAAGAADGVAYGNAGSICLLRHDLQRAVPFLEKAVSADPKEIPRRIGLGTAYAQSGEHARAVEVLRSVTVDDPVNTRAWFLMGQSLIKLGRADEGRQALDRHREIHEAIMKERMSGGAEGHP